MSWSLVPLENIAEINPRFPIGLDESQDVTFLPMAAISEQGKIVGGEKRVLRDTKKGFTYFERGDVLLAKITPCFENGKAVLLENLNTQVGFGSTEFHVIRVNKSLALPEYIFYLLWSNEFRFLGETNMTGSAGQQRVPVKFLKGLEIPLPPLPAQKQIAAVLAKANTLRQQCQKMEHELNALAQSVFLDMFGDPVKNPKNWGIERFESFIEYIGDIGSNGSNATISANLDMRDNEDYALMIRTTNLNKNDFTDNVKYVSKKTYDFFKKSQIFGGEIIMNKIGSAGQFWIMPALKRPVSLGLNQFVIRLKNLNTDYLYYYLSTEFGQKIIQSKLNGATTKSITKGAVKDLPLMFPPIELQNKFSEIIQKTKALAPNKLKVEIDDGFNSLMQRAFKGELELKDVA